jgi:hypothetical protein
LVQHQSIAACLTGAGIALTAVVLAVELILFNSCQNGVLNSIGLTGLLKPVTAVILAVKPILFNTPLCQLLNSIGLTASITAVEAGC